MIERIGDIVRAVRERGGRTLDDLADRSGVSRAVLEALEGGQRGITTTQLEDVAVALSLDPTALLGGREVQRGQPSVFLRHAPVQDFDHDRDGAALDDALAQGRGLTNLRLLLREPPLALQAGVFQQREAAADRSDAPAQDGYRLARDVRRWLLRPSEPLGDVRALLEERFGVAVVVRSLESSRVTAAGVRAESSAAVVLGARDLQRARNPLLTRVHLLHELCHVLFDPSQGGLHIVIDWVTDRKTNAAEQRARAFAAEMLLPLEGLTRMVGPPGDVDAPSAALELVARARSHHGTPHDIAANHLCNLRFVDKRLRAWLEAESTPFAGALPETTLPPSGAASRLVAEHVARAHRECLLTDGEARSTLALEPLARLPWDEVEL